MEPSRWKQIDELVDRALDIPEDDRDAFIEANAAGDEDLKRAVTQLIAAQGRTNEFLQHSAMKIVAKAIADDEPAVRKASLLGKKVATYRIEKLLGAGGMGEVYLAFDEKMRRNVALKILPAEYGSNDERVRRFEMEARAISKINHPNIVTIYDVGNADGINYIATEFVEGNTLRELIGGKFKLRNVMANSIQICDALSAAHAEGIIHRDIKPENVMIRKDGYAKILDFGVAKLTEVGPETIRRFTHTTKGMIIGTPTYMSPAQVSGDPVDARTDLWSCGVVLYEFITGKNPFKGANRQITFKNILTEEPPLASTLNPEVPDEIDRILQKLMQKDPDRGYQNAADLRIDLKNIKRELDSSPTTQSGSFPFRRDDVRGRRGWLAAAGVAGVLLIAGAVGFVLFGGSPSAGPDWNRATSTRLTEQPGTEYYPSISPDGEDFVYSAEENGNFDIFTQRVDGKERRNLTPNSKGNDVQPAFSPDGRYIAFRSDSSPSGIYVMRPSGEDPKRVSDEGFHPSFSPDGKEIVVSSFGRDQPTVRGGENHRLTVINVADGSKREIAKVEASFPAWSPNGHRIAYWFYTGTYGRRDIATIPAGGGEPVVVAAGFAVSNWNPVWSPDGKFLYFVSSKGGNMNFWRVAIDEKTGAVLSEPEAVTTPSKYSRHLSFSRDGRRMLYVQTNNQSNIQGVNFDTASAKTTGEPFWITKGDREISRAELSPDGSRFALRLIRPTQDDIVTVSRDGRDWRDVTNDEPFDRYVRWAPDSQRLAFGSDRHEGGQVWISNADGTGLRQLTFRRKEKLSAGFPVWEPAGNRLAINFDGNTYLLDPAKDENEQAAVILPPDPSLRFTAWDWSIDGDKLGGVIIRGDTRSVGYFSFATGTYTAVVENSDAIPSWLPDSRGFVYSSGHRLFFANISTREVSEIHSDPTIEIRSPFVSRDGQLLYYTANTDESDIWLLEMPVTK